MESVNFTQEQQQLILDNPISEIRSAFPDSNFALEATGEITQEALVHFSDLCARLAVNPVARNIGLQKDRDLLTAGLADFVAMCNRPKFPPSLIPRLARLPRLIHDPKVSDAELWSNMTDLINLALAQKPSGPTAAFPGPSKTTDDPSKSLARELRNHWKGQYVPDSLRILVNLLRKYETEEDLSEYYAKTIVFIQSSGMGKSRLASEFGQKYPMISFVFGDKEETVPPGDIEFLDIVRNLPDDKTLTTIINSPTSKEVSDISSDLSRTRAHLVWYHSIAVGLLQASLEYFKRWLSEWVRGKVDPSLADLAGAWHKKMRGGEPPRNESKIDFCKEVSARAKDIAVSLIDQTEWLGVFTEFEDSSVRNKLSSKNTKPMTDLMNAAEETVRLFDKNCAKQTGEELRLFVFSFDEASKLLEPKDSHGTKPGLYIALNRIISCLRSLPVWVFFHSTESRVESLLPPSKPDDSLSIADKHSPRKYLTPSTSSGPTGVLKRFPPFLAFPIDIGDRERMTKNRDSEAQKGLDDFITPDHMALFGRPIWSAFTAQEAELAKIAKNKLIGEAGTFDPRNPNHVFAALSFRLSLDVCLQTPVSLPLSRTAVNSYMRVMVGMDQDSGVLDTITPSEPILSKAAMELLCDNAAWPQSISTLSADLLEKGLVEKGLKGELYSRLLLTLAQDWVRRRKSVKAGETPEFRAHFTVQEFLQALYADHHHQILKEIDQEILGASLNFTHFVPAGQNVDRNDLVSLCRDLLRRHAAMQLGPGQPKYDILIPAQVGTGKFDANNLVTLGIQVKNKARAITPSQIFNKRFAYVNDPKKDSIRSEEPSDFIFDVNKRKILFLLFDLGVETNSLEVSFYPTTKKTARTWAVHSRGHGEHIFGCLKHMECIEEAGRFFTSTSAGQSPHDDLTRRNWVFRELREDYRYREDQEKVGGGEQSQEGAEGDEGDEDDSGLVTESVEDTGKRKKTPSGRRRHKKRH